MEAQEVGLAEKKSECEPRAKGWETLAGSDDKGLVGHAEEFGLISLSFVSLISEKGSQQKEFKSDQGYVYINYYICRLEDKFWGRRFDRRT